jgi:hypothetical protein
MVVELEKSSFSEHILPSVLTPATARVKKKINAKKKKKKDEGDEERGRRAQ